MNHTATPTIICTTIASLSLLSAALLTAGPLNPPAGPVASTYKTLSEVEPRIAINSVNTPGDADSLFKITQPGSYYLTGNLTGVAGKHGIEIAASGVAIDLSGFGLVGVPGMGLFDGVNAETSGLTDLTIRNGSVRGWGSRGIGISTIGPLNGRVEAITASANATAGISSGLGYTVIGCTAYDNAGDGFFLGGGSTITDCVAYGNDADGIDTNSGSTILNCTAFGNAGRGVRVSIASTLTGIAAYNNGVDGIEIGSGNTATACTAYSNGGNGIVVTAGSVGSTISGCTARLNTLDGIRVTTACVAIANTCASNGIGDGAGIHATGVDNRIEGNNCTGADRGIDVDVAGNIIIRNTCSGNPTNWDVVAGNNCLVVLAVDAAAILGDAGGVSIGSTNPFANFTY